MNNEASQIPGMTDLASEDSELRLEKQVCFSLYSASNALVRAYKPLLKTIGLTYLQYMTMMVLWERTPMTVKEIGDKLHLDSGTLTPLLKRLQDKELIKKVRSEKDERKVYVHLTEQGSQLEDKAKEIPGALMCKVGLPIEQAVQLKSLADLLLKQLSKSE